MTTEVNNTKTKSKAVIKEKSLVLPKPNVTNQNEARTNYSPNLKAGMRLSSNPEEGMTK